MPNVQTKGEMAATPDAEPEGDAEIVNPYVGPVPFNERQKYLFFGREQEAEILLSLAISERIVLFYAQSGAGKSSLLEAGLIPRLLENGYQVLPVVRVGGRLSDDVNAADVESSYVFNTVCSLSSSKDYKALLKTRLDEFLAVRYAGDKQGSRGRYLIFDQFEEILTSYPEFWHKREDFFHQLKWSLDADPRLNLILVMREDHVAGLDRYAPLLPDRLRVRYRMERLGREAALGAITGPASVAKRPFVAEAAAALVDDLSQMRIAEQEKTVPGEFVEPVQLQIVCYQLWKNLKGSPGEVITKGDIEKHGNINKALETFYEEIVKDVAERTNTPEARIRRWFGDTLITPSRIRAQVNVASSTSASLPPEATDLLLKEHLIRIEEARGGKWVELAHDRFITPIIVSNNRWQMQNDSPISAAARTWDRNGRDESFLFHGTRLFDAQEFLEKNRDLLTGLERDFLTASNNKATRQNRLLYGVIGLLVVLLCVAVGLALWADSAAREAQIRYEALRPYFIQGSFIKNPSEIDPTVIDESIKAAKLRQEIAQSTDAERRKLITVQAFVRDFERDNIDPKKVEATLVEIGFKYENVPTELAGIATNAIWFAQDVDVADVQLVALTFVQAGVKLKCIRTFSDPTGEKRSLIQVGGQANVADDKYPALTTEQIGKLTRDGNCPN